MSQSALARTASAPLPSADPLSDIAAKITRITGVQLGEKQRSMVESRLAKRAIDLGLSGVKEYVTYFRDHESTELDALVSLLTTHHTYFFREFSHFEYLAQNLGRLVQSAKSRGDTKLRVWCAACSRGQEVYSLAMFLAHHLPQVAPGFGFEILGTDVDSESVAIARNGVYSREEIKKAPLHYLGQHWARGTGEISEFVKAKNSLKQYCKFDKGNLLEIRDGWTSGRFDIIFCRNVFIYFTQEQIRAIGDRLLKFLQPGGLFFVGISETLKGLGLPLHTLGPSVYSGGEAPKAAAAPATKKPSPSRPAASEPAKALRVLCVDDSPSVVALLKQILGGSQGFEVVGVAKNGKEAAKLVQELKPDVLTLDIHMPEQSGLEYFKQNYHPNHPPVVMVSSVSRDDAGLAQQCLDLGAADYVEKPALADIKERGEEIRMKLRCAFGARRVNQGPAPRTLDQEFAQAVSLKDVDGLLRVIVAGPGDAKRVSAMFREFTGNQPVTIIALEGPESILPSFTSKLGQAIGKKTETPSELPKSPGAGSVFVVSSKQLASVAGQYGSRRASILVLGAASRSTAAILGSWSEREVLIEDLGGLRADTHLVSVATDTMPATSFAYMSNLFLARVKRS